MANKRWTDDKNNFVEDFQKLSELCGWEKKEYFFPFNCTGFEEISIKEIDLSIRSENALLRNRICTLADIVKNWDRLQDPHMVTKKGQHPVRNLGVGSAHEVRCKFYNYIYDRMSQKEKWQFWKKFERMNYRKEGRI